MSRAKRHHYVPDSYLQGFVATGRKALWVYDRKQGMHRPQLPKDTCVEAYFYALETGDDDKDDAFEREILGRLDDAGSGVIRKVRHPQRLTESDHRDLRASIALLVARTRAARVFGNLISDRFVRETLLERLDEPDAWEELRAARPGLAEQLGSADEARRVLGSTGFTIEASQNTKLRHLVELAASLERDLNRFPVAFLHAPDSKSFVTSDAPVVFAFKENFVPDFDSENLPSEAQVLVALSQDVLAVFEQEGPPNGAHANVDSETVRRFNLALAAHARRFLIGRDKALIASLAKQRAKVPVRRMIPPDIADLLPEDLRDIDL